MKARNGLLDLRDFADHKADWVEPISTNYRGYDVLEMPPSTQGFVALEMLNIMEGFDIKALGHNSADYLHVVSRSQADRVRGSRRLPRRSRSHAERRRCSDADLEGLRRDAAAGDRHEQGRDDKRCSAAGDFAGRDLGDTIYLTAADGHGNVVSFIQSLFGSFGAGFVAGETGITLHNRGSGFTLQPGHPNEIGPHKRPLHTLVPAMLVKDGTPWMSFGVMGGDNQAQAHAQVVANFVDFGMHVQEAGDAARVRHMGQELALESGIGADVRQRARSQGPRRRRRPRRRWAATRRSGSITKTGVLLGGSDLRKDGLAIGW